MGLCAIGFACLLRGFMGGGFVWCGEVFELRVSGWLVVVGVV